MYADQNHDVQLQSQLANWHGQKKVSVVAREMCQFLEFAKARVSSTSVAVLHSQTNDSAKNPETADPSVDLHNPISDCL